MLFHGGDFVAEFAEAFHDAFVAGEVKGSYCYERRAFLEDGGEFGEPVGVAFVEKGNHKLGMFVFIFAKLEHLVEVLVVVGFCEGFGVFQGFRRIFEEFDKCFRLV